MKHFNICKQNGTVWNGFHLPISAIFGYDKKGLFVDTRIPYYNTENPNERILYRQINGEWTRKKECNATTEKIVELCERVPMTWSACELPHNPYKRCLQLAHNTCKRRDAQSYLYKPQYGYMVKPVGSDRTTTDYSCTKKSEWNYR